jgi:hypothetical protein
MPVCRQYAEMPKDASFLASRRRLNFIRRHDTLKVGIFPVAYGKIACWPRNAKLRPSGQLKGRGHKKAPQRRFFMPVFGASP